MGARPGIMGSVADQRGEEHPGAEVEPAPRAEPAPQPPADPEQLRQFQQFQQFQDFLRYSEAQKQAGGELVQQPPHQPVPQAPPPLPQPQGQPPLPQPQQQWLPAQQPPPPPPPKVAVPRWLKRFGGKLLSALLLLVVLAIAGKLAYNHFFGTGDEENVPAEEAGRGTYSATELLQPNPYRAVQLVYQQIAQNRPDLACGNLAKTAQPKFAADLGFADCQQAVNELSKEVTNKTEYAQSIPFNKSGQPPGDVVVISSCDHSIKGGGRALGKFVVERQRVDSSGAAVKGEQWLITGHENEPSPCPASAPATRPSN